MERTRVGGGTGAVCAMAAKTAESTLTRSLRALDWSYGELSRLISFSGPPGDSSPSQRNVLAIRACDLPLAACCPPPATRRLLPATCVGLCHLRACARALPPTSKLPLCMRADTLLSAMWTAAYAGRGTGVIATLPRTSDGPPVQVDDLVQVRASLAAVPSV